MKYLVGPVHNDNNTLNVISESKQVSSFPLLRTVLPQIEDQYRHYIAVNGDVCQLNAPLNLHEDLKKALITHYTTKPADLKIIDEIRDKLSPDVCPMCGSLKSAQVDHIAAKEIYPEYAFFTRNLVPACDCNTFKGKVFKGTNPGERVLHPYYDQVLQQRLIYVEYTGDLDAPDVDIEIMQAHRTNPAVIFHVDHIIKRTRLLNWAATKWATIRRRPEAVFPLLRGHQGVLAHDAVENVIGGHLQAKDEEFGTPNNWDSIIYAGILSSPSAIQYITGRINGLRAGTIIPD